MKILVLVAGTNDPSNSNTLADAFIEGMKACPSVDVMKIRLKDLKIDHFTLENYKKVCATNDDFCKIQEHVEGAAGIVIASPVWNLDRKSVV